MLEKIIDGMIETQIRNHVLKQEDANIVIVIIAFGGAVQEDIQLIPEAILTLSVKKLFEIG